MPSVRVPQQSRSRALVARVLQAAGESFAREGFDRTTTNGIAAAAGVSVGSLYQFFGDKQAIFDALQAEWSQRLTAELDVSLIDDGRPLVEIVDDVLEVHARLDAEQPGLLAVLLTRAGSRHTRSARGTIQARLEQLLASGAPGMPEGQRRIAASMLNQITLGLYTVPRSLDPDRDGARAEVRRALIAYLHAIQHGDPA
ncbi:MAG TPA: TetR/AcrR family transcriptional regulator [Pseudolysinimonas sp.]|jgi:AcrR family transcriptional regulator